MQASNLSKPAPTSSFVRFGFGVIIAVFGGLLLWSILAPIDGAVIAPGQVSVESNRKTIQHLEGGVVREILVRENQMVDEGEVLVRLDSVVTNANLARVDSQLAELYARRTRLLAARDGAQVLGRTTGVPEVLASAMFRAMLDGQRELFNARSATLARQIELLEERITQQQQRITGLRAQRTSIAAQLVLIDDELESVRGLYEKGFAPLTRLRALERESERLNGERGALSASLAETDSVIIEAQLEIERIKETSREETISELRDVELSIADLEETRITAGDAAVRDEIKAPQAGRVIGLAVHTVGGVIGPGDPLLDIVPADARLGISARISPSDVEKVQAGQEAMIRFSSFSARMTPQADGIVRSVSADSLIDQVTGAPYYLVLIDLPDPELLAEVLRGELLVPGMPTETFIKTGKQPAISYLLRPLTDALSRAFRED